jgi:hypothetical protein
LNFYGCEVDKIFVDDFPKTRNDNLLTGLVNLYGYKEIHLHRENLGLSATWTEFWNLIKDRNYDYVFHQEDDVEILEPVLVTDLIELLQKDPTISQVQLARQAWYQNETDPIASADDFIYKNFRYRKESVIFSPMASLYALDVTRIPYHDHYDFNLNEGMIGKVLLDHYGRLSANVRNYRGRKIINHIGDWFVGKRVLPGEPSYERWSHFDPDKKYNSRDGSEYRQ